MMMKMIEAGGLELLTDRIREPDDDNPKGYYEFERVKALRKGDVTWLPEAKGKVVKVISDLLKALPSQYQYRVIFMRRNLDEVLASQSATLARKGVSTNAEDDAKLKTLYQQHTTEVEAWLEDQHNMSVMYVWYGDMLASPGEHLPKVAEFLGGSVDVATMMTVVDPALHRQKAD